ncbi:hypothetical protein Lalb_Chr16g0386031 [Lupinus albus]|uniref:Uncharacterized protein n=1 Tax=Lupinus albus TaxID=3870 RepID=A0A6A4P737_LUPAL|nr:hypothetical protein Lalb_Chr16g0386031 [Lupinus albus]
MVGLRCELFIEDLIFIVESREVPAEWMVLHFGRCCWLQDWEIRYLAYSLTRNMFNKMDHHIKGLLSNIFLNRYIECNISPL